MSRTQVVVLTQPREDSITSNTPAPLSAGQVPRDGPSPDMGSAYACLSLLKPSLVVFCWQQNGRPKATTTGLPRSACSKGPRILVRWKSGALC